MRRRYPTDLTDAEWRCIEPYIRAPNRRGRPRIHSLRRVLDAVFYVLRSGCAWRLLPRDFPPWRSVYYWFRKWRIEGAFEYLNAQLRERLRELSGRNLGEKCSTQCRDSGLPVREDNRCRRRAARLRWRQEGARHSKRHLLVDTEGLVLKAKIHSAKVPDQDGLKLLLKAAHDRLPHLSHLWVDAGYQGRDARSGQSRNSA
jgi:putative transposase